MRNSYVIIVLMSVVAIISLSFRQSDPLTASVGRGKTLYEKNCLSCHMADGKGLEGTFPPLAQTQRLADKARLVNILFNGLQEPITVNKIQYDTEMNPMNLTDEQVADVLNYVRNAWGNKQSIITVSEVKSLKKSK